MASDLSSGCTEVIEIFDEKEEGEISLEDVSSSEEGQLNDGCTSRRKDTGQCPICLSTKHCASWCSATTRRSHTKNATKKDAVQEKENCHHTKDSGYSGVKHPASHKRQENNNDLIPISSDSDMEIVGLADNVKPTVILPLQTKTAKVRKRRRKKRVQNSSAIVENVTVLTMTNSTTPESSHGPKRDSQILKDNHLPRVHRRESNSPHKISSSTFTRTRITKSPLRRHRSPYARARSPVLRKSPIRRPRSPVRRSPPLSPIRSPPRRQVRTSVSPSSPIIDMYGNVSKLLKKVRHLKTVGTHLANKNCSKRKGRGPSLKDKLNNMMKTGDDGDNLRTEIDAKHSSQKKSDENLDDEEDLALLRRMALETKPKRSTKDNKEANQAKPVTEEIIGANDDVEDLELRMIALKSAMLKKKEDRIQRGVLPGKIKRSGISDRTNVESPFSQSFLDSIPIPGEDDDKEFKTPPHTPIQLLNENTNPEDMELDSEVELEKEKGAEPYSPTDDISQQLIIESELLGIQPSDVSFVTPTSQVTEISETLSLPTLPDGEKIEILKTGTTYLPGNETSEINDLIFSSQSTYYSNATGLPSSQSPVHSLYSPSDATEKLGNHFSTQANDNLPTTPYSPSQPIDTAQTYFSPENDAFLNSDPNQIPDTPYSPTDTPMYDIEVNNPLVFFNPQTFQETERRSQTVDKPPRDKWRKSKHQSTLINIKLLPNLPISVEKPFENKNAGNSMLESGVSFYSENIVIDKDNHSETSSMKADNGSAFDSSVNSPDSTMITVDELPETDLDGSPLVHVTREIEDIEIHVPDALARAPMKITPEPLYLQGVPDVTKDANKIPTLVNRSLVPASILKSNKNLQQPLPPKKTETYLEPVFKSAQMQPVQISNETNKTNPLFKPIKLAPVIKKPQLKIITPSAFNCSSNDNSILEEQVESDNIKLAQMSKNGAVTSLENLQQEVLSKMWGSTDTKISENEIRTAQPTKTPSSSVLDHRINPVQDQVKSSNVFTACADESSKNLEENLRKGKKTRSRRRRSKNLTKMARNDKSLETRNATNNVSKNTSSVDRQSLNFNKANKNHSTEDSAQKRRSSGEKSKKPGLQQSKRDRIEGRDEKSMHKYDITSNNHKQNDSNKVNDRRTLNKKEQQNHTEILEGKDPESQNTDHQENSIPQSHSADLEKIVDNGTFTQTKEASNIQENDRRLESVRDELQKTNMNIMNVPMSIPTADLAQNKKAEDSTAENSTSGKVEANKRRRSSLDDDEEALRAILLASLAKRSKPLDAPNTKVQVTPLENLSLSPANTSTDSVKGLPDTTGTKVSVNLVYSSSCDSSPSSLNKNQSTLNHSSDKDSSSGNIVQVEISDSLKTKNILSNNVNCDQIVPSIVFSRKRSISSTGKGPLKKIIKKQPMSASAKVVNNAKKYQNTLVQKKLNLQKVAMITNAQKTLSRNNILHTSNNKVIDVIRPRSMITQPLSETQRFVINLESDSESENESETLNKNIDGPTNNNRSEQKPVLAIPMSEFEKSVDLFLKDVRKKQETAAAVKPMTHVMQHPTSPITSVHGKSPVLSTTPLAVRHLPVSQQEEYRRLKQQILEREKLKLHRVLVNNTSPLSPSSKCSGTPPGPLSPASPVASPMMTKQQNNIPTTSQILTTTVTKENTLRTVNIKNSVKTTVSTTSKVNPVGSRPNAPISTAVSNLSIQIPNETTNAKSSIRKLSNSYIPVSNSQTRLVTAVDKTSQEIINTKDSTSSVKDQLNLKNVQIQLQQGKTGRKVSLGETLNLTQKTVVVPKIGEPQTQECSLGKMTDSNRADMTTVTGPAFNSSVTGFKIPSETDSAGEKASNSADLDASTLIISRDDRSMENSTLVDSSTSTVIISRNQTTEGSKTESISSESSKAEAKICKPTTTGPKKLKNNTETWEKIRGDVTKELDAISALPSSEQKSYLATVEQNLVKKRYAILDDLSEISGNLRQLEMEREVQSNMASEVKILQEQLRSAEERLQAQRSRVNKIVPNVTAAYEKFNNGRRECVKMTRICLGLGCLVIGANYKIPAAGAQLLNNRLKQVAGCTRQLSNKKATTMGKKDGTPPSAKTDLSKETDIIENILSNPLSEPLPNTIPKNSSQENSESITIANDKATENPQSVETELAACEDAENKDKEEQEMLIPLEKSTISSFAESVSVDSPKLTSTPNSSKENPSFTMFEGSSTTGTFGLDTPRAGLSEKFDRSVNWRFLQPYESVLAHLTVPRTADPIGILCPYELMGTCRDEECQFVHQSARNG